MTELPTHPTTAIQRHGDRFAEGDWLRLALEAGGFCAWDYDVATGLSHWDEGLRTLYGVPLGAEPLSVEETTRLVHPDDRARLQGIFLHAVRDRRPIQIEFRIVRDDGRVIWVALHGMVRPGPDGGPGRVIGVTQDITRRKRDEARLAESEERFRILAAASREGVAIHDGGVILFGNETFATMFGYGSTEEVTGQPVADFIAPAERDALLDPARVCKGEPYESVARRRDGTTFPAEVCGRSAVYAGRPVRVGVVRDLSERKQAEAALTAAEARIRLKRDFLETLLRQIPVGVSIALAPDGRAFMLNEMAMDMIGKRETAEDATRYADYGAIHSDGTPYAIDDYPTVRALRRGEVVVREPMLLRRPNGAFRHLEVSTRPVRNEQGAIAAAVTAIIDLTPHRQTEEKLRLLTAELSHRVKNILAVIQSLAMQTALRADTLDAFKEAFTGRLQALGAAHGLLLANRWNGLDLADLARQSMLPYADAVHVRGPTLHLSPSRGLAMAVILHELATNALKHGALAEEGGRIDLSWSTGPHSVSMVWVETLARPRQGAGVEDAPALGPTGFGTRLIRRSAEHDLNGEARMDVTSDGVRWRIDYPVEDPEDGGG